MENMSAEWIWPEICTEWLVSDVQFIIGVKNKTFRILDQLRFWLVGPQYFGKPIAQLMESKQLETDCSVNNFALICDR